MVSQSQGNEFSIRTWQGNKQMGICPRSRGNHTGGHPLSGRIMSAYAMCFQLSKHKRKVITQVLLMQHQRQSKIASDYAISDLANIFKVTKATNNVRLS